MSTTPAVANPEAGLSNSSPSIHLIPEGSVTSHGDAACKLAEISGTSVFPWQRRILNEILGETADGFWTAQHSALVVARQNGKGEVIAVRELFGLLILGERIIHTAHLVSTALEGFQRLEQMINSHPDLKAQVSRVSKTNGREAIHFKNGGRINFMARSKASARGFTVDLLVLDEAMMMSSESVAALNPTISAVDNPQVIYAGSAAPSPEDAEHLGGIRAAVVAHLDNPLDNPIRDIHYAEWSADVCDEFCLRSCQEHDAVDSPITWAKANPSLGLLQTVRKIEAEYNTQKKTGIVQFLRERLSVGDWPVDGGGWKIIRQSNWESRIDESSELGQTIAFAVDVSPDRSMACISVAGLNTDGLLHVEITGDPYNELEPIDHREGTSWVVPRLADLVKRFRPCAVVVDKATQAGALVDEMLAAGIEVIHPTSREYAQSCGSFRKAVMPTHDEPATLVHLDQGPLNLAVAGADKRDLADLWAWSRKTSSVDITPLVSASLALFGFNKEGRKKKLTPWVRRGLGGT